MTTTVSSTRLATVVSQYLSQAGYYVQGTIDQYIIARKGGKFTLIGVYTDGVFHGAHSAIIDLKEYLANNEIEPAKVVYDEIQVAIGNGPVLMRHQKGIKVEA